MDDDELLALLRESFEPDAAVSERMLADGRGAYAWVRLDAEVADEVFDSADEPLLAGVRGGRSAGRQVTYEGEGVRIECEVGVDGLVGEVVPAGSARLRVRVVGSADLEPELDEHGRFAVPVPGGPFSVVVLRPAHPELVTPWLLP